MFKIFHNGNTIKLHLSIFLIKIVDILSIFVQSFISHMSIARNIANSVGQMPEGYVFTYRELGAEAKVKEAVIKALNRMVDSGKLSKLSKGKYYKPKLSPFGILMPNQEEIVKDLLEREGRPIGYLTGYGLYNQLGLTTQVSNTIHIGRNDVRPRFKRSFYKIAFIRQKNIITKDNIPLLQILDAIRYIKDIPDTKVEQAIIRLLAILRSLSDNELREIIQLSLLYSPATRALLGAMIDELERSISTNVLLESLNPISKYRFLGASKVLPSVQKWSLI